MAERPVDAAKDFAAEPSTAEPLADFVGRGEAPTPPPAARDRAQFAVVRITWAQGGAEFRHCPPAIVRLLGQPSRDGIVQPCRDVRPESPQSGRRRRQVCGHDLEGVGTIERHTAADHLEDDDRQAVNVRPRIHTRRRELFGRCIADGADELVGARDQPVVSSVDCLRFATPKSTTL